MDLGKYRAIFIEESTENLSELSSALLELEKDPSSGDAIDVVFRMAHSIKGMAASLEFDSITEIAHLLEDRMQVHREAGRVPGGEELALIFKGLEGIEGMVAVVRDTGESPPPASELAQALAAAPPAAPDQAAQTAAPEQAAQTAAPEDAAAPKKKLLSP